MVAVSSTGCCVCMGTCSHTTGAHIYCPWHTPPHVPPHQHKWDDDGICNDCSYTVWQYIRALEEDLSDHEKMLGKANERILSLEAELAKAKWLRRVYLDDKVVDATKDEL